MGNLTGWHALIILAVVLLIFGAAKLPTLARSVGESVKILKKEARSDLTPSASAGATSAAVPDPQPVVAASGSAHDNGRDDRRE